MATKKEVKKTLDLEIVSVRITFQGLVRTDGVPSGSDLMAADFSRFSLDDLAAEVVEKMRENLGKDQK
jgi:hypothetical protein